MPYLFAQQPPPRYKRASKVDHFLRKLSKYLTQCKCGASPPPPCRGVGVSTTIIVCEARGQASVQLSKEILGWRSTISLHAATGGNCQRTGGTSAKKGKMGIGFAGPAAKN